MSSPYSVSAGYSGAKRIPTASAPPPIVQRQSRKPPPRAAPRVPRVSEDSGEPAESPYAISSNYNAAKRLIPTASGAPPVREIKKARITPRGGGGGGRIAAAPSMAPHAMAPRGMYARAPAYGAGAPSHSMQAQWGAPAQWAAPPQADIRDMEPENLDPPPPPVRFELPEGSFLTEGGILSSSGVAIYFDKRMSTYTSSASNILSDLVADIESEVQLQHDADSEQFPEIGEALKAIGQEEGAMTVAFCHGQGVWAVGLGGPWKRRETIAKLALCVALVEKSEKADEIFQQYPEFAEYCGAPGAAKKKKPKKAAKPVPKKAAVQPMPARAPFVPAQAPVDSGSLPRDVAMWIRLPGSEPAPEQLEGLASEALAICTDGTKRKGLYSSADRVLSELVGDIEAEVQFHDDCNWVLFPTVGAGLKEIAKEEVCMCVAVCPSKMAWAVGVGMKGKSRYAAAKAAIAATIHLQATALGEELPELSEGSALLDFVNEAQVAKDEAGI